MDKNLITKRKIYGFSTIITLNQRRGDVYFTDGTIDSASKIMGRFNDPSGRETIRIDRCTYVVYSNGDKIIIESRDYVENDKLERALAEVEKRTLSARTIY
ncbi:hypothetical protein J6W91_03465 [Candidatus Saccharibacteria bacterium]|nr:hypothetical protein [Candidatus Saccharibacteria bacterium]